MTTIEEQLRALTVFMPMDELRRRVAAVTAWLGREADFLIPSTSIGTDGISLSSMILIAGDLISEMNLAARYDHFDVMKLVSFNIRITLGVHEVKDAEKVVASYHTASVVVQHASSLGFTTTLSYAGLEPPDHWLNAVKAAFPVERLATPV